MNVLSKPISLIIVSSSITIGLIAYSLTLIGNNKIVTISDLGLLNETAVFFSFSILTKSIFDIFWLKKIREKNVIIYLYPLFFSMLLFLDLENNNLFHWSSAILFLLIFIYFQFSKLKILRSGSAFVFFGIVVAAVGITSEKFYLLSETIVFLTIVVWQLAYSLKFQRSKSLFRLNK